MKQLTAERGRKDRAMDQYLSETDVWAIAFGCIIGWGAFVMPGTTFLPIAGPGGTGVAMALSAAIMVIIGLNYAYLMMRHPGTGGVYTYTKEAFGREHAFLSAWFLSLSYISIVFLNATALLVVSRTLLGDFLKVGFHYEVAGFEVYLGEVLLSVGCLVFIGAMFILKKPFLQRLQTVLAILLLAGTMIVSLCCLPHLELELTRDFFGTVNENPAAVIMTVVLLSPWAFVGFDVISLETAHFHFPVKRSGWIMVLSIVLGSLVYVSMSLVSITALPSGVTSWQQYVLSLDSLKGVATVPSFYAARVHMGGAGVAVMAVTALAAILTGVIGAYRATIRVLSTMAEDGILSERFSSTTFCVLFIMGISAAVSFLGRNALEWFVELTTFGAIVGFAYTSASALRLAYREKNWLIAATGILGTMITAAFALVQLVPKITLLETMGTESFLMLAFWCLLGYVFYWRTIQKGEGSDEYLGGVTATTVLFSLLLYSVFMWFALRLMEASPNRGILQHILRYGLVAVSLMGLGFLVMIYIQNLHRVRNETLEKEKIMAEERSRAKTRFLFNMSHDIRTPMNAILGYTELARKEKMTPLLADYLDKVKDSSENLLDLINDILEMSRMESGTVELESTPTDLHDLLLEVEGAFAGPMQEKGIHFALYDQQVRHPYVRCDRACLRRLLLNLTSNAYKFTPEGGRVQLTLWEVGSGDRSAGGYEFRVKDSGIGMSEDFARKMFTAFERERTSTDSGMQGTGLGLAIAKSIIDLMGGRIQVDTAPGEGTEFRVYLTFPLCTAGEAEETKRKMAPPVSKAPLDLAGRRILLVDDQMVNREIASAVLAGLGCRVETAQDGAEAVDKVLALPEDYYDAVLMDIQMPVMDGYGAARELRSAGRRVPILAMTADAFEEDKKRALQGGMNGHVAKPLDMGNLTEELRRVLAPQEA